jgi:hypothetical protein
MLKRWEPYAGEAIRELGHVAVQPRMGSVFAEPTARQANGTHATYDR